MSDKTSDRFIDIINKMNHRELLFTWYRFGKPNIQGLQPHNLKSLKEALMSFKEEQFLNSLLVQLGNDINFFLIDKQHFEWIDKDNTRLLIFLLENIYNNSFAHPIIGYYNEINIIKSNQEIHQFNNNISNNNLNINNNHLTNKPPELFPAPYKNTPTLSDDLYSSFIYHIDLLYLNTDRKINIIEELKNSWSNLLHDSNSLKWIQRDNDIQIKWAFNYLKTQKNIIYNYFPITEEDLYPHVLASIDRLGLNYSAEKKLVLNTMRRTWSQKKFRESNKVKKPYHLPLTKRTQDQLGKLVQLKNMKKEDIIEELINQEFSNFTDSNGKFRY